ncbi:glycosyltransferase [uncultured Clostridium sp.]|uniref:glycosyltransferase n=1 Tax=uncultured Clostridium sp. TaxID=59620 RepID=UPI0025F445B7|nr:glycosyltransferase [uncultured Clostridium sp.]
MQNTVEKSVRPIDGMKYSVLMPVYDKENPAYFQKAAASMLEQTAAPDEFVLVCDGPLNNALEAVIKTMTERWPDIVKIVRLPECGGIARALAIGVETCRNEWIARMDSDDIACPDRCEKQLRRIEQNKNAQAELALISGAIAEFEAGRITGTRSLPCKYEEILRFAKKRNPMNHMAVMMRRSAVLAVGNYHPVRGAEDYELWVRLLQAGYRAENLPDILVYARTDNGMIGRRGGIAYARSALKLQKHFYQSGFLSFRQYLENCAVRAAASLMPGTFRRILYRKKLRCEEQK